MGDCFWTIIFEWSYMNMNREFIHLRKHFFVLTISISTACCMWAYVETNTSDKWACSIIILQLLKSTYVALISQLKTYSNIYGVIERHEN